MPNNVAIGVGLMEFPFSGAAAYWRWVDLCEAGGVDSIWQSDRVIGTAPALECMSVMAALAGRTRRLKFGMRLQTDPTVIYGMGDSYRGNIRRDDLEADTPFNTYTRDGLPPTPIALPGLPALEATLHPAPGDALYFVARGDGSHEFSATLDEHNRAVQKYQLHRNP